MTVPTRDEFTEILKQARVSKRLMRDLRFVPEAIEHLNERDFLAILTKSGNEGVLLFKGAVAPFELQRRTTNKAGRAEAIICDICATWQRGTNSSVITFRRSAERSVSYLVCGDLACSLNVRDKTKVSKLSRTQLREHITPEARIVRLNERLQRVLAS